MQALTNSTISHKVWKQFNKCRLYLNVISLAKDICTGDGLYICNDAFKGNIIQGTSRSNITWPPHESPPTASWKIWSDCLIKLFCLGTTGKLSSRLGPWYPCDACYNWEWYIHCSASHLLHIFNGKNKQYMKVGRSQIAPRFDLTAAHIDTTSNLDDYLWTTVDTHKSFYLTRGLAITGFELETPASTTCSQNSTYRFDR